MLFDKKQGRRASNPDMSPEKKDISHRQIQEQNSHLSDLSTVKKHKKSNHKSGSYAQIFKQYDEQKEKEFVLDGIKKTYIRPYYDGLQDKHLTEFLAKSQTLDLLKRHGVISKFRQDGSNLVLYKDPLKDPLIKKNVFIPLPLVDANSSAKKKPFSDKLPALGEGNSPKNSTLNESQGKNNTLKYKTGQSGNFNIQQKGLQKIRANVSQDSYGLSHYQNEGESLQSQRMKAIVQKSGYRDKNTSSHSEIKNQDKDVQQNDSHLQQSQQAISVDELNSSTQAHSKNLASQSNGKIQNHYHINPGNYYANSSNLGDDSFLKGQYNLVGAKPKFKSLNPPFKMYKFSKKRPYATQAHISINESVNSSMSKEDFSKMMEKFKEKAKGSLKSVVEKEENIETPHLEKGKGQEIQKEQASQ